MPHSLTRRPGLAEGQMAAPYRSASCSFELLRVRIALAALVTPWCHSSQKQNPGLSLTLSPRRILRSSEVVAMCGLSRSTICGYSAPDVPRRCRIAPGAVGWLRDDIDAWL